MPCGSPPPPPVRTPDGRWAAMQPGRVVWQPLPLAIPPIRSLQWSNPSHIQQPIAPTPPPPYTYSAPGLVAPTVLSFDNPSTQVPTTSTSASSKQSYIPVSSSRISSSSTLSGDNTYQTSVVRSAIPRSLRPAAGYPMVATALRGQPRLPPPIENESVRPSADPRLTTLGASPVRGQLSSKQGAQPSRLPRYRTSTEAKAFRSSTRGHGPAVQDARHENPRPSRSSALPAATVATKFASDSSTILTSSADLSYPGPTLHADSPTLFRSSLEYLTWPEYFQRVDYGKAIGRGTEPCNFGPPKRLPLLDMLPPTFKMRKTSVPPSPPMTCCTRCHLTAQPCAQNWQTGPCGVATLCNPCGTRWQICLQAMAQHFGWPADPDYQPSMMPATSDTPARPMKYCTRCHTEGSPRSECWRRGPCGTGTLCNACGIRWEKCLEGMAKFFGWLSEI